MEFVKLESRDKLRIMTISRESVLNALNRQVMEEISHVVELLENDDEAEVLIITRYRQGFRCRRRYKDTVWLQRGRGKGLGKIRQQHFQEDRAS